MAYHLRYFITSNKTLMSRSGLSSAKGLLLKVGRGRGTWDLGTPGLDDVGTWGRGDSRTWGLGDTGTQRGRTQGRRNSEMRGDSRT